MIRTISIQPVLNGFICEVGCQRVVFETRDNLLITLGRYLDNPDQVEKDFLTQACNARHVRMHLMPQPDNNLGGQIPRTDAGMQAAENPVMATPRPGGTVFTRG